MSLRDTILQADDIATEIVEVPEWDDVKIELRAMDGTQHAAYIDTVTGADTQYRYADILIASAYNPETGEPVFDPADRDLLMSKHGGVLMRLSLIVIRDLSGTNVDEAEEELEENPTSGGS